VTSSLLVICSCFVGVFWSAHQRFFRSLCIATKVDKTIALAKQSLRDGLCVVIGLQSTGEARAKGAALAAGFNDDSGGQFDDFVSAPTEDLKRIIMAMFPLPPKPKGVIAPVFFNNSNNDNNEDKEEIEEEEVDLSLDEDNGKRKSRRIPWDQISLDLDVTMSVKNERLVNYRKAVDNVMKYMSAVDKLELPPNPLDR